MIQANELRLGNWVDYKGKYYQIYDGIRSLSIDDLDSESLDSHLKNIKLLDLRPISLTEEILMKCGFEKVEIEEDDYYDCSYEKQLNSDVFISYSYDFSCALYWSKEKSENECGVLPNWHSIDTVHGLQNLHFILTGEELNIQL